MLRFIRRATGETGKGGERSVWATEKERDASTFCIRERSREMRDRDRYFKETNKLPTKKR